MRRHNKELCDTIKSVSDCFIMTYEITFFVGYYFSICGDSVPFASVLWMILRVNIPFCSKKGGSNPVDGKNEIHREGNGRNKYLYIGGGQIQEGIEDPGGLG